MKTKLLFTLLLSVIIIPSFAQDWMNVGTDGITSGQNGRALIEFDGNLVMGGYFSELENVAIGNVGIWNGSNWAQLGDGINGDVRCMAILNNELYIGGNINSNLAGNVTLPSVCKLVNGNWVAVSNVSEVGIADDMLVWNNELYVVSNDWSLPHKVMKFNGIVWSQVGSSIGAFNDNQRLEAIEVYDDELYLGGRFADVGTGGANRLAKFNGTDWESVSFPMSGEISGTIAGWVNDLEVHDNKLFVGGLLLDLNLPSMSSAPQLASFDGTDWAAYSFDANIGGSIISLLSYDGHLYCGGDFGAYEEDVISTGVAIWNDEDANDFMSTGMYADGWGSSKVDFLGVCDGSVYSCGNFADFGSAGTSKGIARFNGVIPNPATSINEVEQKLQKLELYPNPSSDLVQLKLNEKSYIKAFDMLGNLVFSAQANERNVIDVSKWNAGIYSIVAESENKVITERLVIQR
ncbi:MAG: T9SS type A sorting domain-containing protein [Flavobacteriales bacterium]|nr:T9SS type A sorting domain-containing protein [Flavobacteriales bacterium]